MNLRKITIDNSVKFFAKSEKIQERVGKSKMIRNISLPEKQKENFLQNNKKFNKDITRKLFGRFD